jgi:hypothetical protein
VVFRERVWSTTCLEREPGEIGMSAWRGSVAGILNSVHGRDKNE